MDSVSSLDSHLAGLIQQRCSDHANTPWQARCARQFEAFGLPTSKDENWKYTSIRLMQQHRFESARTEVSTIRTQDLARFTVPGLDCHRLTFVDGHFAADLSFLDDLPDGCNLGLLGSKKLPAWAESLLEQSPGERDSGFFQLNGALAEDGLILQIEAGVQLDSPLQILCLSTHQGDHDKPARISNLRHLVCLKQGASATLLEQHVAMGPSANLVNVVSQFELAPEARLDRVHLQQLDDDGFLVSRTDASLLADSRLRSWHFDLGARLARHDANVALKGEQANCELEGVFALDGGHHVDHHTRVDHIARNTSSNEVFKGVLNGKSRGVFNGKVVVHKGADGTDARQSNANLLLSKNAEIDTKPELEIYADDVKCAHGATVGELDANQVFYLRSRGISEPDARTMLIQAFCREVIEHLELGAIQTHVRSVFDAVLPGGEQEEKK